MATNASGLLVIERILRDRNGIWRQIVDERDLGPLTLHMLISSTVALAVYGAVMGSFGGLLMTLTSAVKLPMLFLVTLAICLPTLYLFNLVFGARLSVRQAVALVMTAFTVIAMLSVAFAPISLFFRITITEREYEFFKLLNVGILALTAFVGLRFLTSGMRVLNAHAQATEAPALPDAPTVVPDTSGRELVTATVGSDNGGPAVPLPVAAAVPGMLPSAAPVMPPGSAPVMAHVRPLPARMPATATAERSASMTLLYVWILLFGFVGTQLAWTLRPFFGAPTENFALFRDIDGNFYSAIFNAIGNLFG